MDYVLRSVKFGINSQILNPYRYLVGYLERGIDPSHGMLLDKRRDPRKPQT